MQQTIQLGWTVESFHAAREAIADHLKIDDIWASICSPTAEIIEDYPTDPRGASCLILSFVGAQPIHTVVAHPAKRRATQLGVAMLAILITVYRPDDRPLEWSGDYRTRPSPP